MNEWRDSTRRKSLYRAFVKGRVEVERRLGPSNGAKRALALSGRGNLSWLAAVYGSDKGATAHRYVDHYERHLGPLRHHVMSVLEIGIYRGASLQMWRDYFPNAQVYGLDINDVKVMGERIHTLRGDQSDEALLARIRELGPFDVIIDDGSHFGSDVHAAFAGLFGSLQADGMYVIEDMHTAYQVDYGGGPPGHPCTSVTLVQSLIDAVNREHVAQDYPEAAVGLPEITALHVYPRIAFIQGRAAMAEPDIEARRAEEREEREALLAADLEQELAEVEARDNPLARFPVPVLPDKPPSEWRYRRAFRLREALVALVRSWQIVWGLVVRQLRTMYSQQVFGLWWTVMTPVAQMVVFTFLIRGVNSRSKGAGTALLKTHGITPAVWLYVGLLGWTFYSSAVSSAGLSLVGNPLLNKVYTPREVFPLAQVATSGFDALVSALILPFLLLVTQTNLTWSTVWAAALPITVLAIFAIAVGLVVSGFTVYARDLRSALPIIMSLGLFMPGVIYPISTAWKSVKLQTVYSAMFPVGALNDAIRKSILLGILPGGAPFWTATVASCVYLAIAYSIFKRMETGFADVS